MITARERVTREDLVMFINACFACTGQREFYADARGQAVSLDFLHAYILGNYRLLYARSLSAGINHFNQAQAIVRLLATGRDTPPGQRDEEGALIAAALRRLPVHRAYHVLRALQERRVNNRRARAVVRDFLASRPNLDFEAVKYRRSMRAASTHAHLCVGGERGALLFRGARERRYSTPLFEAFRKAHFAESALYELPYTIAEGLARIHKVPRKVFLARIEPRLSAGERLRLQGASDRALGERVEVDLKATPPTRVFAARPLARAGSSLRAVGARGFTARPRRGAARVRGSRAAGGRARIYRGGARVGVRRAAP